MFYNDYMSKRLKPEFGRFMDVFKDEVDVISNEYMKLMSTFQNGGIESFIDAKLVWDLNHGDVNRIAEDYINIKQGFGTLSNADITFRTRTRQKDGTVEFEQKKIDPKGLIKDATFTEDQVKALATTFIEQDHATFYYVINEKINNKAVADKMTRAIFGKSIKHR